MRRILHNNTVFSVGDAFADDALDARPGATIIPDGHIVYIAADDTIYISADQIDGATTLDEHIAQQQLQAQLAVAKPNALNAIAEKHAEMLTLATGGASAAERDTWVVKETAAMDVIGGSDGFGAIMPISGETALQLSTKISAKAFAYRQLVGIADHIKRTAEKAVESLKLETVDDLAALDAVLETANQQATAALQQATSPTP